MTHPMPAVLGGDSSVRLPDGATVRAVQLNNAATTPPFVETLNEVNGYLQTYGALHRGAGPNAHKTVELTEAAIETIRRFLNLRDDQSLLFCQNTSAAINLFARLLDMGADDVAMTSDIEHTSNNLPWRFNTKARVVTVRSSDDGALEMEDLEAKLRDHAGKVRLVTITGASNLTGYIPDLARASELAHEAGAELFVDAAQLAPHRPIDMRTAGIDALAFSAHKVYAPFGLGILALPTALLDRIPVDPGGGSIDMLNAAGEIVWAPPGVRHQTGTWNVTGIIAAGASCRILMETGWERIIAHERVLVNALLQGLEGVPGLTLHVPAEVYGSEDRIGTIPFSLDGYHHVLLSAILDGEYGIETRAGTICNHRLVRRWFNVSDEEQARIEREIAVGNRLASYGMVRASLGIQNASEDIDRLVEALRTIATAGPKLQYHPMPEEEIYAP